MWFAVLGPVEANTQDGHPISLRRPLHRALLAALLFRANRPVAADELVELLWPGDDPGAAKRRLKSHVWALRRLFDESGEPLRIERAPGGYRLALRSDELDLHIFERLAEDGIGALRRDEPGAAIEALDRALSLWRGRVTEGVVVDPGSPGEVASLEERRWTVREARFDAGLALGQHTELVSELRTAVAEAPHRERLRGQLMLALYRAGRQGEALATFRELRERLTTELGVEPSPPLRELESQILNADPALDPPEPRRAESRHAVLPVPRQLPASIRDFVGRTTELSTLDGWVERETRPESPTTICVLDGPAGVGKTALATHFAHRVREHFPDGQLYADLRGFGPAEPEQPDTVLDSFLHALAVDPDRLAGPGATLAARAALFRTLLADRRMLILLDNARDAEQVRPLLPGSAALVLVTSRDQLHGLVNRQAAHRLTLAVPETTEALELLTGIIGEPRVAEEPAAAASLLTACDRLPLAIRIVGERAARQSGLSLARLREQLGGDQDRLDGFGRPGVPDTDLRQVFSWSHRALPEPAARGFLLLGLHPVPVIGVAAAAALLGAPVPDTAAVLDQLANTHLLHGDDGAGYRFHDLVHSYAAERAGHELSEQDRAAAVDRCLNWYLHNAGAAGAMLDRPHRHQFTADPLLAGVTVTEFAGREHAFDWCERERTNLVPLVRFAATHDRPRVACQLVIALRPYLNLRRHYGDWFAVSEVAAATADRIDDPALRAVTLNVASAPFRAVGRYREAVALQRAAVRSASSTSDDLLPLMMRSNLGVTLSLSGEHEAGLRHLLAAHEFLRQVPGSPYIAPSLNNIAMAYVRLGDLRQAAEFAAEALDSYVEGADRYGEMHATDTLGVIQLRAGDLEAATANLGRAAELARAVGHVEQEASTLSDLGTALYQRGREAEARAAWERARSIYRDIGDPRADQADADFQRLDPHR